MFTRKSMLALLLLVLLTAGFTMILTAGAAQAGIFALTPANLTDDNRTAYPAEDVYYNMTLQRLSPTVANETTPTVNFTITSPAGWQPISYDPNVPLPTAPTTEKDIMFILHVPADAMPGYQYNFSLNASDVNSGSYLPSNRSFVVRIRQVINLSCSDDARTAKPNATASYTVKVWNKGASTTTDLIALNVTKSSALWNATLSADSVSLKGGEYQNVVVSVIPPASSMLNESATATLNAVFDSGSGYPGVTASFTLTTTVDQKYGALLYGAENVSSLPGQAAVFNLNLSNTGNGNDAYILSATGNAAWFNFGAYQEVNLSANQTTQLAITMTPPSDTVVGAYSSTITAASKFEGTAASSKSMQITVSQVYDAVLAAPNGTYNLVYAGLITDLGVNSTRFNITVRNAGNGLDTLFMNASGAYANNTWLSASRITLAANASENIYVLVNVSSATLLGDYNFSVTASSGSDANKTSTLDFTAGVVQSYGAELLCQDASNTINPAAGNNTTYTIEIRNVGNAQDTITINITSAPTGWASLSENTATLDAGARRNITLSVSVPSSIQAGNYTVTVSAAANNGRGNLTSITTNTTVAAVYGIRLTTTSVSASAAPGGAATFPITVSNIGTGADVVALSVSVKPSTWQVSIEQSVSLAYGASVGATLSIAVPSDAASSASAGNYNITILASSGGDAAKTHSLSVSVYVSATSGVALSAGANAGTAPGSTLSYPVTVRNNGNSQDTIDLIIASFPTNWTAAFYSGASLVNSINLAGSTSSSGLLLRISVPAAETSGGSIIITARSQRDTSKFANLTIATSISLPTHGVSMHTSTAEKSASPGAFAAYPMTISNTGNVADTFLIQPRSVLYSLLEWNITFIDDTGANISSVLVGANSTKTINAYLAPPRSAESRNYSTDILVTSQSDAATSSSLRLVTYVLPVRNITIDVMGPSPSSLDPNTNRNADCLVSISNFGNVAEDITWGVEAPPGWTFTIDDEAKDASSFTLARNTQASSTLRLVAPADTAESGQNEIYIELVAGGGLFLTRNITLNVAKPTLVIRSSDISYTPSNPAEGDTVLIRALARNTGDADANDVQIRFLVDGRPIGSQVISVAAGSSSTAEYSFTVTKGTHTVEVNVGGDIIQGSSAANSGSGQPLVGEEKSLIFFTKSATLSNLKFIGAGAGVGLIIMGILWAYAASRRRKRERTKLEEEMRRRGRFKDSERRWSEYQADPDVMRGPKSQEKAGPERITENEAATKPGSTFIRCPDCGELKEITTAIRPIQVECGACGKKMAVKK